MSRVLVVALVAWGLLVAPAHAAVCPNADMPYAPLVNDAQVRTALMCLVNNERVTRGLKPVTAAPVLDLAASRHLADMAARGYVSHVAPAPAPYGATPRERAAAAGYPGPIGVGAPHWDVGETLNIVSQPVVNTDTSMLTARSAIQSWMASTGHCATILTQEMQHFGAALLSTTSQPGWVTTSMVVLLGGISQQMTPLAGCPFAGLVAPDAPVALPLPPPAPESIALGATGVVIASGAEITLLRGARAVPLTIRCSAATACRGTLSVRSRGRVLGLKVLSVAPGATKRLSVPVARKLRRRLLKRTTRGTVRLDVGHNWATHNVLLRG